MEEIEERESELGFGGQEPWWLRQEETMNSNVAGHPRETVSLNPRLNLLFHMVSLYRRYKICHKHS